MLGSINDQTVGIGAAWVNLSSIEVTNYGLVACALSVSLHVPLCKLLLLNCSLSIAILARRLSHNDILDIVVDRQINSRLLHFYFLVSAH